jgi:hypothetical protein
MAESIEQFVRRQNIERYRELLGQGKDEARRRTILALLAREQQEQRDVADPIVVSLMQAAGVQFVMRRVGHY